jgi:hypothetical protein
MKSEVAAVILPKNVETAFGLGYCLGGSILMEQRKKFCTTEKRAVSDIDEDLEYMLRTMGRVRT